MSRTSILYIRELSSHLLPLRGGRIQSTLRAGKRETRCSTVGLRPSSHCETPIERAKFPTAWLNQREKLPIAALHFYEGIQSGTISYPCSPRHPWRRTSIG